MTRIKKTIVTENRLVFYVDESAFYLLPQVRKTWATVGQTPILTEGCRDVQSVMGAMSHQGDIDYRLQESSYTGSAVVQFIQNLLSWTPHPLQRYIEVGN